jgi:hypothetical protein
MTPSRQLASTNADANSISGDQLQSHRDLPQTRTPAASPGQTTISPIVRAARTTEYLAIWTVRMLLVTVLVTSAIVWRRKTRKTEKD